MSEESGRKAKSDIGQFAIVPKWLLLSGVSGNAIKCFGILCALFVDRDTGEAWPSRKKMSELVGCSESSYDRYLKELVDVGAVSTERQWAPSGDPMPNLVTVHYLQPNEDRTVHGYPEVYSNLGRGLRRDDEQSIINEPESSNHTFGAAPKPKRGKFQPLTPEQYAKLKADFCDLPVDDEIETARAHVSHSKWTVEYLGLRKWMANARKFSSPKFSSNGAKVIAPGTSFSNLTQEQLEEMDISNWGKKRD